MTHNSQNFALVYGQGLEAIAMALGVSVEETEQFRRMYLAGYPALSPWMDMSVDKAHEDGYVTTHFGRRVTIHEYTSPYESVQAKGDRLAVNAQVQGTAADLAKIAMVRLDKKIKALGLQDRVRMVMNIHDAVYFYVDQTLNPYVLVDLLRECVEIQVEGFPNFDSDWCFGLDWSKESLVDIEGNNDEQRDLGLEITPEQFQSLLPQKEDIPLDQRLVLHVSESPDKEEWAEFRRGLALYPGQEKVELRVGEETRNYPQGIDLAEWISHVGLEAAPKGIEAKVE